MATLKGKTDEFKNISNEMDTGGAPIYADDLLRIQENNRADTLNYFESLRRLLPELLTWDGATQSKQFENGIILSGLEYDNSNPSEPVISEGYILSGGEVCYYPGGTIVTGGVNKGLLYLYKGAAAFTARTFAVGGSKDILVTHNVTIEVGSVTVNGLELDGSTAISPTDEVVVLGIGGGTGDFVGEDYFTTRTALGLTEVADRISSTAYSSATISGTNTVGLALPYLVSRVNNDGTTEIHGSISIKAAEQSGASIVVANIPTIAHNINSTGSIPLNSIGNGADYFGVLISITGDIRVLEPLGGWPGLDFDLVISARVYGNTTPPSFYDYKNDFLNIT